jgi:hypothetical protein
MFIIYRKTNWMTESGRIIERYNRQYKHLHFAFSQPHLLKIHLNIIFQFSSRSFTWLFSKRFRYRFLYSCWLFYDLLLARQITVAEQSKVWTLFAHSNTGIVGSNPTRIMDVYVRLFLVCVVLCVGSGIATGWSPVQGVLPTVHRIRKLKKRPRSKKDCRATNR